MNKNEGAEENDEESKVVEGLTERKQWKPTKKRSQYTRSFPHTNSFPDSCIACFSQYYSSVIHLQDYTNVVHLKFDIKVVPFITTEEPQDF